MRGHTYLRDGDLRCADIGKSIGEAHARHAAALALRYQEIHEAAVANHLMSWDTASPPAL